MSKISVKVLLTIAILACCIFGGYSGDIPSEIQKCKSTDNDNCIVKTITEIFKRYPKGNPEFGMPNVSALPLTNVVISKSDGISPIQMNFKFNSFTALGLENLKVLRASGFDKEFKKSPEVDVIVPRLRIQGEYESNGKLLLLPLNGKGKGDIELIDAFAKIKAKLQVEKRGDKSYAKIKKLKAVLEPKKMTVKLENIVMGNPVLTDSLNSVINENWSDVWSELHTGINSAIERIIINIVSDIFNELPIENFYSD